MPRRVNGFHQCFTLGMGVVACMMTLLAPAATDAATIYFADIFNPDFTFGSIRRIGTDGTGLTTLLPTGGGLRGIDIDSIAGKIYWTDVDNFAIRRSNLDGTGQEDIITSGLVFPSVIAVDHTGGKIYWGDQSDKSSGIYRANLDGSEFKLLIPTSFHRGIAIDHAGGKIYWTTSATEFKGDIRKANLDGTDQQIVVSSLDEQFKPSAITLDLAGGKIYWTDYVVSVVRRANLNGTGIQLLYQAEIHHNPRGIALDIPAGKVYWGQDLDVITSNSQIMRMNLDGTAQQVVMRSLGLANYLVIPAAAPCPADLDHNGVVNGLDLAMLLAAWTGAASYSPCPPTSAADLNGDCKVNGLDLAMLLAAWGPCP